MPVSTLRIIFRRLKRHVFFGPSIPKRIADRNDGDNTSAALRYRWELALEGSPKSWGLQM